jgi:hypothetical protein
MTHTVSAGSTAAFRKASSSAGELGSSWGTGATPADVTRDWRKKKGASTDIRADPTRSTRAKKANVNAQEDVGEGAAAGGSIRIRRIQSTGPTGR